MEIGDRFWIRRYGPSRRRAQNASVVLRIFVRHTKKTFATISATSRRWPEMPSRAANGGDQNVREDVAIALRDVRQNASCGQRLFRHAHHSERLGVSLNILRPPPEHSIQNVARDALGGIDLSCDRPGLPCLFNPSRHGMACHQVTMSSYKIGILLHSNFRPRAAFFIPTN